MYVEFERTEDATVTNLYYYKFTQKELDLFNDNVKHRLQQYRVKEEIEPVTMQEVFNYYEETVVPAEEYFKLNSKLVDERTGYFSDYKIYSFTFNLAEWLEEWINENIWDGFIELRHKDALDWDDDINFVKGE